jgi:hypothetical protein
VTSSSVAAPFLLAPPAARADYGEELQAPSIMNLKLKPREQEVILETKAEHVNEDFSHNDLVGAIYTEGDLRGSDFRCVLYTGPHTTASAW